MGRLWFNGQLKARGNAHRAQQTQLVFLEAQLRLANGAQNPCVQIRLTIDIIKQLASDRIVEHAVDREISAQSVFSCGRENDLIGTSAVAVISIGSKGCDL